MLRFLWICLLLTEQKCLGAHFLGVFPSPSISHQLNFQAIYKELALRGHQVTVISPFRLKDSSTANITEIEVASILDMMKSLDIMGRLSRRASTWTRVSFMWNTWSDAIELTLNYPDVGDLIRSGQTFDAILLVGFSPLVYAYGAVFDAPLIVLSSYGVYLHTHDAIGNPTHPVVSPEFLMGIEGELKFTDRLNSLFFNFWYRFLYYWYEVPRADRIARKYLGNHIPYLGEIEKNISLVLVNINPIMYDVRPNVPNMIEVDQVHIQKRKPLPKDIQEYLDSSSNGVVYFSLGSNVKSSALSPELRNKIFAALAELPYNVLYKWETDSLSGKPPNVLIKKWLPQQDVLAHPNIKVFVTQGGTQSIEEALVNGVPMVGIPFIIDQPINVRRLVDKGLGVLVNHENLTKENLRDAIMEVAQNKKYKEEVTKARNILNDQPLKGAEKAVWWIEYVVRHKGARHLRSPIADMTFFEYFMMDVVGFLVVSAVLMCYVFLKISHTVKRLIFNNGKLKIS